MWLDQVLIAVPAFIVAIGLLVVVHEYGHFWVARRLGVKVLRFSVGFGPKLWGRRGRKTDTEFWLSALPLGGYVKMLDEREGEVSPAEVGQAFNRQALWKRTLIVLAGPGVNFLFALLAYWLIFIIGVPGIKPLLGEVESGTIAWQAGLRGGEEILEFDGDPVATWNDLRTDLMQAALQGEFAEVQVGKAGTTRRYRLDFSDAPADPEQLFPRLGLHPPSLKPIIGEVLAGEPAQAAGLREGDRILSLDGQTVNSWNAVVAYISARPDESIAMRIDRDGETMVLTVIPESSEREGEIVGRIGAAVEHDPSLWQDLRVEHRLGPVSAVPAAAAQTWSMSMLTVKLLWRMVVGDVSWRNVSGPIQIANYAGKTASIGLVSFLGFLALVSVSLGILNLLPVPVLDGGHLLYYAVEAIQRRPLSEQAQMVGQQIGIAVLLLVMCLAFYNDILNLVGA